jgi:hypothetical protein
MAYKQLVNQFTRKGVVLVRYVVYEYLALL